MLLSDITSDWPPEFKGNVEAGLVADFDKWPPVPGSGKIDMVIPGGYIRSDPLYQSAYVGRKSDNRKPDCYKWRPGFEAWEPVIWPES